MIKTDEKEFASNDCKEHKNCMRCGRKLKNPKWTKIGYGPTCYKKMMKDSIQSPLFEVRRDE